MSAKTPPSANRPDDKPTGTPANAAADNRVFVAIPKAGPGQHYQAPKNFDHPLLDALGRLVVLGMCAAVLLVPGVIMALIMFLPLQSGHNNATQAGLLWLWIPMFLFVEAFAVFITINLYREGVGSAGEGDYRPPR
jgi:hypothetical protein